MTCEEIDRELAGRNQQLAAIATNLMELQGDATYQLLVGSAGVRKLALTGETASRVLPALSEMEALFQQFGLLEAWLERVAKMRRDLRPVFGREQALKEMEAALHGEAIRLPETALPLGRRTLLSGLERARGLRPDELLGRMVEAFAQARDAVLIVGEAWEQVLAEVEAAEAELRGWRGQVDAGTTPREIVAAEALLAQVKAGVESDPLGARTELRLRVRPALETLAGRVRLRVEVRQQVMAGYGLLEGLARLEGEIAAAVPVSLDKIAGFRAVADGRPGVESLRLWLGRLEQHAEDETLDAIAIGVRAWHRAAAGLAEQKAETLRLVRAPLELRRELRGRLEALKAKARAYGMAEDAAVVELAGSAEALLYAKPTDLKRAEAAVEAYERKLSGARPMSAAGTGERRR